MLPHCVLPLCVSLLLLALALASSAGAQAPAPAASSPATKWTVLVYMLADNDLDCAGMVNLEVGLSSTGSAQAPDAVRFAPRHACWTRKMATWPAGMLHIMTLLPSLHHLYPHELHTTFTSPTANCHLAHAA
jgi:hypothetical protein